MKRWKPPKSPIGMLQEQMWPDAWKILIVCVLHNQTSRKQVDKVYKTLFDCYPNPASMSNADHKELVEIIRPLGFYNRRAQTLVRLSKDFLEKNWETAKDLYGCGKYADDCYRVFFTGDWKAVKPTDHALNDYVDWLKKEKAHA
tara:strand:+ start:230 stop:661 length:432 start_codon:yes stop_codon:yes gene_type:complete